MQITYCFRMHPASEQEAILLSWLDLCRKLYNLALEDRQTVWETEKRSIGYRDQQNKLPAFKKDNPEYKGIHSQVLQDVTKSIYDASWGKLLTYIEYKSKRQGKRFIKIPPGGTSQTCICGASVPKDLSVRVHTCPKCGYTGDRDIVSAKVIKMRGLQLIAAA